MKCFITGHTTGLGKEFYNHFSKLGWEVDGISISTGYDIVADYSQILSKAAGCDLFINNAYADGMQLHFLEALANQVGKMIVCGSVVTEYPDPELPKYTEDKIKLEKLFLQKDFIGLLLKLSGDTYNTPEVIMRVVDFWLENPEIKIVSFKAGKPNR